MGAVIVCTYCREKKPPEAFYRNARKRNGKESWCKACRSKCRREMRAIMREPRPEPPSRMASIHSTQLEPRRRMP